MEVDDDTFVWDMYIAPIADDLLLGCDFLDDQSVTINTRRGLEIQGKWVECHVNRKQDSVSRVCVDDTITRRPSF
jgi:hypothetical protein